MRPAGPPCPAWATVTPRSSRPSRIRSIRSPSPIQASSPPSRRRTWPNSWSAPRPMASTWSISCRAGPRRSRRRSRWRGSISWKRVNPSAPASSPGARAITATPWARCRWAATCGGASPTRTCSCRHRTSRPATPTATCGTARARRSTVGGSPRSWKRKSCAWVRAPSRPSSPRPWAGRRRGCSPPCPDTSSASARFATNTAC